MGTMVKAMQGMKAMKGGSSKVMTKSDTFAALEASSGVVKRDVKKVVDAMESVVTAAVKSNGKVVLPGICRVVLKHKKATKAGKRMAFGKMVTVKAKPARKKVFPVKAL